VNEESIVYLANLVTIPHIWMSCVEHLREPDRMVWDLDPMGMGFDRVKSAAKLVRFLLGELGLESYPMLTGSRGIHVVVFVKPEYDVEMIFDFTRGVAQLMTRKLPQLFTVEYSKSKRGRKIYLDYHRNVYAQTAVSPYAIRAIEGAPVAMPITWEDVDSEKLTAQSFPMKAALKQLEKEGQSWTGEEKKHDLGPAKEKLERLLEATRVRGAENFLPLL
jgi:bifunctional non-homologous end joining protein LigD